MHSARNYATRAAPRKQVCTASLSHRITAHAHPASIKSGHRTGSRLRHSLRWAVSGVVQAYAFQRPCIRGKCFEAGNHVSSMTCKHKEVGAMMTLTQEHVQKTDQHS
eukprot:364786-Chlamydomonas_euryale.AAC.7